MKQWRCATTHWRNASLRRGAIADAEADATSAIEGRPTLHGFHPALFILGETRMHRGDLPRAASYLEDPEQGEEDPGVWGVVAGPRAPRDPASRPRPARRRLRQI